MQNIQEIFDRVQETSREKKNLQAAYRDALENTSEYLETVEELKTLKERKKQMENAVKAQMDEDFKKIERLQQSIVNDKQLLSDVALTTLIKGEPVNVTGPGDVEYEPLFTVRFKKKNV
jgi:predicted nuclease with TOPRIM domain